MSQPFNLAYLPVVESDVGHRPQPGQNYPAPGQSDFIDGSGPLFQMYLGMAAEEDKKRTDNWTADADGILIFTGLFSAAVATLVSVSVQDLKPNSQDISAFYLAKMYQLSADSNGSQVPIPSTLSDPSIPFSPPTYAVWVNSLWFLSLVISLTCALLATLLQQWARRYMKLTQKRYSLHKRARIRAFFSEGVDKLHLPLAVEALPTLLHLSLFLFFVGLAVFLFNTNYTVFKVAMLWICSCTWIYICITFMPMFWHDSPYYAPLSLSAWYLYNKTLSTVIGLFRKITSTTFRPRRYRGTRNEQAYQQRILRGMEKDIEETAFGISSQLDGRALAWTFESLDEDHELEQFFAGIPGFCGSKVVDNPQSSLAEMNILELEDILLGFLQRTLSSNILSGPIKERRFIICVRVIDITHPFHPALGILHTFLEPQHALLRSVEIGHSLTTWVDNDDRGIASFAEGIVAFIIANAPQRDPRWFALTMHHLRIPGHVLRGYLNHGDSMLLANLIHITRQLLHNFEAPQSLHVARMILSRLSNLRVQDTLPGLQHDFCQLWNNIVGEARKGDHHCLLHICLAIRPIYLALHQGTDTALTPFSASNTNLLPSSSQASSYPLCSIPSHCLDPTLNLNEVDDGGAMETARAPTTTSPAVPHSDAGPSATPLIPNSPPSPTSSLDRMNPQLVDELSRDEVPHTPQRTIPAASSSHRSPLENDHFPASAVARPVQGIAVPLLGSSMANFDAASRGIGNTTITTPPPFNPNAVPPHTPILTVSRADSTAPHVAADFTGGQFDHTPHGGLVSPPSSHITASSLLAPCTNSDSDPSAMTEIGPPDAPDDTLGPNCRVMSQSPTSSSPNIVESNLRSEDRDPSENV